MSDDLIKMQVVLGKLLISSEHGLEPDEVEGLGHVILGFAEKMKQNSQVQDEEAEDGNVRIIKR